MIPEAAQKKTDAGAEAFVRYFFDQFNTAWTTPKPGLIKSLSDPECKFCKKTESTAQYLEDHGQRYREAPAGVKSVIPFGGAGESEQYTEVRLVQNESAIVDREGKVVSTDPRKITNYYVTLRWKSDQWFLLELEKTS